MERQEEDCCRLAQQLGLAVADVYVDNDLSAFSGKRRPAYERMLLGLAQGRRDARAQPVPPRPAEARSFM